MMSLCFHFLHHFVWQTGQKMKQISFAPKTRMLMFVCRLYGGYLGNLACSIISSHFFLSCCRQWWQWQLPSKALAYTIKNMGHHGSNVTNSWQRGISDSCSKMGVMPLFWLNEKMSAVTVFFFGILRQHCWFSNHFYWGRNNSFCKVYVGMGLVSLIFNYTDGKFRSSFC